MAIAAQTASAAADPYIESDGTSGISTGYRMKGDSRVEVDFALTTTDDCAQWRILGDDVRDSSLRTYMYIDGDLHFTMLVTPNGMSRYTTYVADTQRHIAVFDLYHSGLHFITDGVTNWTTTSATSFTGREADLPLSLFARYSDTTATKFEVGSKARIYGVKIYERDILVRDFVPCLRDGETPCFKDLVGGGFILGEDVSKFTAGGDVPTFPDNAYVSTAANANGGMQYIDTGYKVSATTAVAIDCAFSVNTNLAASYWMLFDCNGGTRFNVNFNRWSGLRFNAGGNEDVTTLAAVFGPPVDDKDVRRTFFLDNLNTLVAVVTSGYTNQTTTFTVNTASQPNGTTLKLASDPWATGGFGAFKIYGCKIWENGTLVRDFVPYVDNGIPGIRDCLTGTFRPGSDKADNGNLLAYGGTIAGERDAYLESNGTTGLNTGCKIKGTSRIELDFALTEAGQTGRRIFGTDTQESVLTTWLGTDGAGNWRMIANANSTEAGRYPPSTPTKCDTARHTAIMSFDSANGGTYDYRFITGGTTNTMTGAFTNVEDLEASMPLALFARYGNAEGTSYHNYTASKARLYSLRIYESDALAHEFLPYSRDGVAGLYDTVTGDVISNGSSFTFGGAGQDHGQLKAYVKPGYKDRIDYGETTQLTAYAPGATSYRWLMDGQPIAGGTDGVLAVEWARGGTKTGDGYVHTYQAIAVFNDFYGVNRESEPTEAATVTSVPRGMVISVK